jgi:hypothetical protein
MGIEGDRLASIIRASLQFRNIVNAGPELKAISDKAVEALLRVAKTSKLNERRVGKFGIRIDS